MNTHRCTHTHTHSLPTHMCVHCMVCPWARRNGHTYTWLSCRSVHCGLRTHTYTHTIFSSAQAHHMHIHKCPIHTCPSTHMCNCSDRMGRCPIVLAMYTHVHVCATPTRSAYTHLHTVLSICMHAPTHAQLPCQDTHTHKIILPAHIHACTHKHRAYITCVSLLCPSHIGEYTCVSV